MCRRDEEDQQVNPIGTLDISEMCINSIIFLTESFRDLPGPLSLHILALAAPGGDLNHAWLSD